MKYFSGFCLQNEGELFSDFISKSDFNVVGFSYGAIKAFEYVLSVNKRVDKLILISPAFFQNYDLKFKRVQLINFKKNSQNYIQDFLKNATYSSNINLDKYLKIGTFEELEELLNYEWKMEKLLELKNKNIKLELYLGEKDKIIDVSQIKEFFLDFATIYYIKDAQHFLK